VSCGFRLVVVSILTTSCSRQLTCCSSCFPGSSFCLRDRPLLGTDDVLFAPTLLAGVLEVPIFHAKSIIGEGGIWMPGQGPVATRARHGGPRKRSPDDADLYAFSWLRCALPWHDAQYTREAATKCTIPAALSLKKP
jgi:hypothetical protein